MALSSTGHNLIRFYLDLDPMRLDICENCDLSMVFSSHTPVSSIVIPNSINSFGINLV
jgi:hypothetical protein